MAVEKIILGIDPGTTIMGFGIIKAVGKKMEFIQMNELMLKKYDDHYLKLKHIFERYLCLEHRQAKISLFLQTKYLETFN